MKKRIVFVVIGLVMIMIIAFFQLLFMHKRLRDWQLGFYEDIDSKNGVLCINDEEVPCDNIILYRDNGPYSPFSDHDYYADFPFIPAIKSAGGDVQWKNLLIAELIISDRKFILDFSDTSPKIIRYEESRSLIPNLPYGNGYDIEPVKRDFLVGHRMFIYILNNMDVLDTLSFDIDYDEGYISYDIRLQ